MAIYNVCFGDGMEVKNSTIDELMNEDILLRTKSGKLTMSKEYKKLFSDITHHDGSNGEINGGINGGINSLSSSLRDVYLFVKANPGIKIKKVAQLRGKAESTVEK